MPETKKLKKKEKGSRGEREIVMTLGMVVTRVFEGREMRVPDIKRTERGCDIDGLVDYAFEVKRDETPRLKDDCLAWEQVETFAKKGKRIPVLFYRANNKKWRVKIKSRLDVPGGVVSEGPITIVDITIDSFLKWFHADLDARIGRQLYAVTKAIR